MYNVNVVRTHAYPCTSFSQQSVVQQRFVAPNVDLRKAGLNATSSAILPRACVAPRLARADPCVLWRHQGSPIGYFKRSVGTEVQARAAIPSAFLAPGQARATISTGAGPSSASECSDGTRARPSSHLEAQEALGHAQADISSAQGALG